jgi:hypothetical protein
MLSTTSAHFDCNRKEYTRRKKRQPHATFFQDSKKKVKEADHPRERRILAFYKNKNEKGRKDEAPARTRKEYGSAEPRVVIPKKRL